MQATKSMRLIMSGAGVLRPAAIALVMVVPYAITIEARASRDCSPSTATRAGSTCGRGARLLRAYASALSDVMGAKALSSERTVVLLWDKRVVRAAKYMDASTSVAACNMHCEWTTDRSRVQEARAIAFALESLPFVSAALSLADKRHLPTIGISREKENRTRNLKFANAVRVPPYFMTHKLDSHVPMIYFETIGWALSPSGRHMLNPDILQPHRAMPHGAAIAAFISNCKGAGPFSRLAILASLAKHGVPVHHYGECGHNIAAHSTRRIVNWHKAKLGSLQGYRFLAAMENARVVDYVSEKVYDGLRSGVLPIYLGAPNVYDFLPCDESEPCIIHVADYIRTDGRFDASRLSAHLRHLAENGTAYAQYFLWRERPASPRFVDLVTIRKYSPACRMCHCLRGRLGCDGHHAVAHPSGRWKWTLATRHTYVGKHGMPRALKM